MDKKQKETGYDFNINVSQIGVVNAGLLGKILFEEIGIFEMFIKYTSWSNAEKIIIDNEIYYAFNWKIVKQRIPTLKAKGATAIRQKIKNLVTVELLKPHVDNQQMAKSFYAFGEKYQQYANIKPYRKTDKEVIGKPTRPYRKTDKEVIGKPTRRLSENRQAPYRKTDNKDSTNDNTDINNDSFLKKEFLNFSKKQEKWIGWKVYLLENHNVELSGNREEMQMEHLKNLSENDVTTADQIITQAVAGNYKNFVALIFKKKKASTTHPDHWDKKYYNSLTGERLVEYKQHLVKLGFVVEKYQGRFVKFSKPQTAR